MGGNNFGSGMSFTDGDDVTLETEQIMNRRESSNKRRRSGTKDVQGSPLPPLIIKDLSISPSDRGVPLTVGISTNNQLTDGFDDDLEVCILQIFKQFLIGTTCFNATDCIKTPIVVGVKIA